LFQLATPFSPALTHAAAAQGPTVSYYYAVSEEHKATAAKAKEEHRQRVIEFRQNGEMVRDLRDAMELFAAEDLPAVQMPLLNPRVRCYQVAVGEFTGTPKFCAGLILPGDNDDAVLAELLVTMEGSSNVGSGVCSEFEDENNPAWTGNREVEVWMKVGNVYCDGTAGDGATLLCSLTFGDSSLSIDSGPDPSRANATISFAKEGMQQVKRQLQIDETASDYALLRLWLSTVACCNQQPAAMESTCFAFKGETSVATGTERKLTLQLNTLQAFMDATTEGGPRRAHEAVSQQRAWWTVSWSNGIAQHWGTGNAVNNSTKIEGT
jgi:hypothetical protein